MEQDAASGLVTAHHGASVLLHGGRASESLWELCLPTLLWTEHRCTGHVPPPRLHHAGGVFMGRLVVCGGAPLDPMPRHVDAADAADPPPSSPAVPQGMGYWELDLDTLLWTEAACTGPAPLARSHHSATVVRGQLVVIGGRPTAGPATTRASAVTELMSAGYFDAHVLDIASRTWRNLSFQGSIAPALWGHSAVAFNDRYVLVFGGMDVSQQPKAIVTATGGGGGRVDDPPPSASLSDVVFTFDVDSCAWSRCTPDPTNAHPPARAQHLAACFGLEMVVMCGFTAVPATGRVAPLADAWLWNVQSGRWRQLEPSAPLYPSVRPPAAMYYDQLVLLPSPQDVHFLSMRDFGPWQRVSASADLRRPVERNPFDADNATSGASRPLATSAQRFMLEQEAAARRRAPDEYAYPAAADHDARHHHSASPEAHHHQARSAQSDVAGGNSAAAWADQLRSRLPPREPVVADPWAAGAARGDHVTAPPPAREVSPELAKLQREVERLRQLAGPEESEARSARRDPSRPPVITYEPGRAAFAGETLRDAERARGGDATESSRPPARAPRSFVDSYLRDADAREAQNASSSSSHPSLLLTASSIDDAALPDSLRDLKRYREKRQGGSRSPAATNRTARATAAAPADASRGRHARNSHAESRYISPDAQQEHADAAISLLPSSRHHRTLQDEVTQPSYAPRR